MFLKLIKYYIKRNTFLTFVPEFIKTLFINSLINTLVFWVTLKIVSGIYGPNNFFDLLLIAAIYSLTNAIARPALLNILAPLLLFTLGAFTIIINIIILYLTSWLAGFFKLEFYIGSFVAAIIGSLVITVIQSIFNKLINSFNSYTAYIGDRDWIKELDWVHSYFIKEIDKWKEIAKERESIIQDQRTKIETLKQEEALLMKQNQRLNLL
jgi:putative membrane protein